MSTTLSNPTVRKVLHTLVLWSPLWIFTTLLFGVMGGVYAFVFKEDAWLASQALMVRDEANGAVMRLGRFESQSQMKASQETILEMSKNHQVVHEALVKLGPQPGVLSWLGTPDFPSNALVAEVANYVISVHAPKGTEFGVSEVIYLDTKLSTPERSIQFNKHLCDSLEERLRQVRKTRADSIIAELKHARDAARIAQNSATKRLQEMETKAGLELSDLRGMTDSIAGGSNSRTQLDQIRSELRAVETQVQQVENDLKLINDAIQDPSGFLVTPNELVNTQPGLRKLREGYADAQISASQLSGKFTEKHPILIAAKTSQSSIRERLIDELQASRTNREQELKLLSSKQARLNEVLENTQGKLGVIAESRAEYANLISEVKTRTTILESAERELAEASASSDASLSTSLITRMDLPVISDKPIGPGRTTITGLCSIAGLFFGLGLVFVLVPSETGKSFGRRLGDMGFGRRREDSSNPRQTPTVGKRASDRSELNRSELNRRESDSSTTSLVVSPVPPSAPSPATLPVMMPVESPMKTDSISESISSQIADMQADQASILVGTQLTNERSAPIKNTALPIPQKQKPILTLNRLPESSGSTSKGVTQDSRDQIFRELSSAKISSDDSQLYDAEESAPEITNSKSSISDTSAERRQHPRSTKESGGVAASFGLRPSGKKTDPNR